MSKIVVSKVDASRRQLSAAVRLLFAGEDPIVVHTIACAGYNIARNLAAHRKLKPEAAIDHLISPELRGEFWTRFNRAANFLKHANRDPEELLSNVDEEVNDFVLSLAISCFIGIGEAPSPEMRAYLAWFMVSHPRFFPSQANVLKAAAEYVGYPHMTREQRLKQGSIILEMEIEDDTCAPGA